MARTPKMKAGRSLYVVIVVGLGLWIDSVEAGIAFQKIHSQSLQRLPNDSVVLTLRGGAKKSSTKKKKKSSKKKTQKVSKEEIAEAMKEKDTAEIMADTIRSNAHLVMSDDPTIQGINSSVSSVGAALGATDHKMPPADGGGVEAAPASVIANYFLKSHGGAHALQTACSLLAVFSGLGVLLFSGAMKDTMLRRTLIFAMIKHVSGLLAAAAVAAKAIPKIGLSQSRLWMEQLVLDPVSQYVFYSALLLLWLPDKKNIGSAWWNNAKSTSALMVGPILLREIVSILFVLSDVLVLSSVGNPASPVHSILNFSQSGVDAIMSLLVTPQKWRSADAAGRQAILAKLIGKTSLFMEVAVGLLLAVDFIVRFFGFAFSGSRPSLKDFFKRIICIRLYIHFLLVRRGKITSLGLQIRGGAAQLPIYLLDVLYEPMKAMGIDRPETKIDTAEFKSWQDYASFALGFN